MGEVVRLAQFQNKETVALLRALTVAAVNGDVIGVDVMVRLKSGRMKRAVTGPVPRTPLTPVDADDSTFG